MAEAFRRIGGKMIDIDEMMFIEEEIDRFLVGDSTFTNSAFGIYIFHETAA